MPRGSKPGERRGGRKPGVPNKVTLFREAETVAKQHASGMKLGKEIMQEAANYFLNLAAKYQIIGDTPDEKKFHEYLKTAALIAKDLAPYESPRLATITVSRTPLDLSRLSDVELAKLRELRERATPRADDGGIGSGAQTTRH